MDRDEFEQSVRTDRNKQGWFRTVNLVRRDRPRDPEEEWHVVWVKGGDGKHVRMMTRRVNGVYEMAPAPTRQSVYGLDFDGDADYTDWDLH